MPRPPYCINMAPTTAGNILTLNISAGSKGCCAIQPSHHVATAKTTNPKQAEARMYDVFQPCGAPGDAVSEKTTKISPDTIRTVPGQSILMSNAARSSLSQGIETHASKKEIALSSAPIKKYQRQLKSWAASPAKNMPRKNPKGAQAP